MADMVMEGRVLAQKYELVKLLGQGGMGAVYEARNHLGKRFAVKMLLKAEFAQDPQLAQRFFREAKASAAIESQHIVQVYDTGVDQDTGFPFIIMELLKGEDLEHTIARVGALNIVGASRVISQAAMGLHKAHESGIVHRDIKPANIFMTESESGDRIIKILDFGIAKQTMEQLSSAEGAGLTKTGSMLGTPLYMSPEQAQGLKTIDHRTDVWSLGMCLYEALSGRTPWGDVDTLGGLILSICSRDVAALQDIAPWVPPELALVVHQCLVRDITQRTPSAYALVEALRPFTTGSLQIGPEVLLGVEDAARAATAPRADISTTRTTAGTTTTTTASGKTTVGGATKSSMSPVMMGAAAIAIVGVIGGAYMLKPAPAKPIEKDSTTAPPPEPKKETAAPATPPPAPAPVDVDKVGKLKIKASAGQEVKIDNKVVHPDKDGFVELTGKEEKAFYVTWKLGTGIETMKVYMGDNFIVPDEVDTTRAAVKVPPPPKSAGGGTAPTPTGPAAGGATPPPTGGATGPGPATPPTTPKARPKIETEFN
jgi:serine/threonine-protein kinase